MTLRALPILGFSKRAVLTAAVDADDAVRDPQVSIGGRKHGTVGRRCTAVDAPKARGERAEAGEPHLESDLGDWPVGVAQQPRRSFEAANEQILVRSFAEGAAEF